MRFISGALQAESCYNCPYAAHGRVGDLTLADYWGYQQEHPGLAHIKGVSLVLVNTTTGEELLERAEELQLEKTDAQRYQKRNHHLSQPGRKHPQRDALYGVFETEGFTKAFYKKHFLPDGYGMYLLKRRLLRLKGR